MSSVDPRFGQLIAAMERVQNHNELWSLRKEAELIARAQGKSFDHALAELRRPAAPGAPVVAATAESYHSNSSAAEREPPVSPSADPSHLSRRDEAIAAALAADPSRSDRSIAREARCSPTLVGRARAAAGLTRRVRTVRRGGQSYEMRVNGVPAPDVAP